jgi:hypothetical protein
MRRSRSWSRANPHWGLLSARRATHQPVGATCRWLAHMTAAVRSLGLAAELEVPCWST